MNPLLDTNINKEKADVDRYREALQAIYRELDAEIAAMAPVCVASGRCCRFLEYGHTLFLSEPEARLLLADAPTPSRPLDEGATCPWQNGRGLCQARDARPLGCRVYYCDPAFEVAGAELSERYVSRLKHLADDFDLSWNYGPLHRHLAAAKSEGRYPRETFAIEAAGTKSA